MIPNVEQFIGGDVLLGKEIDPRLAVPGLLGATQKVGIPNRISDKHVPKVEVPSLDGLLLRQATDPILLHPVEDMGAEVLAVDLPVRFEILTGGHFKTLGRRSDFRGGRQRKKGGRWGDNQYEDRLVMR